LDKPITNEFAQRTIAKLLFPADADEQSPIKLFINCPGGVITAGMAIFDVITEMKELIHTHCYGFAGGFATVLMAHGQHKNRSASPGCEICTRKSEVH
jgi:ATP-dependent Clp protease protease subunit